MLFFEQIFTQSGFLMELYVEIYHSGQWHQAAVLELLQADKGRQGAVRLIYDQAYALNWMFRDDEHACSLNLPVELMLHHTSDQWFGFMEDIVPAGASRRYWITRLGIGHLSQGAQDSLLLEKGSIAPVGNMRIRNALPSREAFDLLENRRFDLDDVVERQVDFLDYAQEMGAASGGATGAGGEAPKLILRCSEDDKVWIDTWQDDPAHLNKEAGSFLNHFDVLQQLVVKLSSQHRVVEKGGSFDQ
nr:hypothetical protein [Nitrincola lacisaponensis]